MRIALALVLTTSCGAPPCPLTECAEVCPDAAIASELILQPWQAAVLKDDLADLRAGLQFQGGARMCLADTVCGAGSLPDDQELDPAPLDLYTTYRTPKYGNGGDYRGDVRVWCADVVPGAVESLQRPTTFSEAFIATPTHGEWQEWRFFRVPGWFAPNPQRCAWSLDVRDPDGRTAHLGGHFLRKAPPPPDQALRGLPADASTPGVTVIGGPTPPAP